MVPMSKLGAMLMRQLLIIFPSLLTMPIKQWLASGLALVSWSERPTTQVTTNHLEMDEESHLPVSLADGLAIPVLLRLDGLDETLLLEKRKVDHECAGYLGACHSLALVGKCRLLDTSVVPLFFLCLTW